MVRSSRGPKARNWSASPRNISPGCKRFSDYEESESQDREWIIAWGRQEIQEQIEADGDPYGRLFDTSYREEYWPQLRAAGFTEEKYPAFDCTGSVWGNTWREMQHVHDPEAQALALEWENR